MNAYNPPCRQPDILASWPSDDCCDVCCATPVRIELDGDKLCQTCADKWARNEQPGFEDDLVPMDHPVMREALAKWNAARLSDAELVGHSRDQRRFVRGGGL